MVGLIGYFCILDFLRIHLDNYLNKRSNEVLKSVNIQCIEL